MLAIKFKRARVDGESARRRARLGGLVDDARSHSQLGQPEREDETRRPGAGDQDIAARHRFPHVLPEAEPS